MPYSAVPVLACTGGPGTSSRASALPSVTTARMSSRTVAAAAASTGGGTGAGSGAGWVMSRGASQAPRAMVAAACAMAAGLASTRPWPMVAAASSTAEDSAGTSPVATGVPTDHSAPMPTLAAAAPRSPACSRDDRSTKAVLQERAKSVRNGTSPSAMSSTLPNARPCTVAVAGQGTVSSGVSPVGSSASVLTVLNVDPGG